MDAADWASLSDQELLERRISKLGLRARHLNRSSGSSTTNFFSQLQDVMLEVEN
jgi:hypothetical protein